MIETTSTTNTRIFQRVPVLDALRGLAVALVLIYHLHEYVPLLWPGLSAFGETGSVSRAMGFLWIGVDLFYVLSGFFIGMAVLRPSEWRPLAFIKSRLTRILPAYYVSLIVIVALLEPALANQLKGWVNIVMHVLMLHSLQEWTMFSINGPYWTLGVEFGFYVAMLALAPALRLRHGWLVLVLMFAVCYVWRANLLVGIAPEQRFFWGVQLFGALDEFALGIAVAMAHQRGLFNRFARFPVVT
ncbi:MAG: acyltransferase, partial [Alcaligenaceae bacterium]